MNSPRKYSVASPSIQWATQDSNLSPLQCEEGPLGKSALIRFVSHNSAKNAPIQWQRSSCGTSRNACLTAWNLRQLSRGHDVGHAGQVFSDLMAMAHVVSREHLYRRAEKVRDGLDVALTLGRQCHRVAQPIRRHSLQAGSCADSPAFVAERVFVIWRLASGQENELAAVIECQDITQNRRGRFREWYAPVTPGTAIGLVLVLDDVWLWAIEIDL